MNDILHRIAAYKYREVALRKQEISVQSLTNMSWFNYPCRSLSKVLQEKDRIGVIAEFKHRSPSQANINLEADLEETVKGYVRGGASAISVLTDTHFFGGKDQYLSSARDFLPDTPILRKEFILDPYQVYESKALGADVILLISEMLTKEELDALGGLALDLGMEVLVELHNENQLGKIGTNVSIVGVNNRDLKTFQVDYERSLRVLNNLNHDTPKIAESGLSDPEKVHFLRKKGFDGFLIGEHFMRHKNPGEACKVFIDKVVRLSSRDHIVN